MLKIRLTQTAEQHLEDIWFYTLNEWSEEQANQYVGLIERGVMQLPSNPYIGKARPDIKKDLRSLQIQKHLVFYVSALNTLTSLVSFIAVWMPERGCMKNKMRNHAYYSS